MSVVGYPHSLYPSLSYMFDHTHSVIDDNLRTAFYLSKKVPYIIKDLLTLPYTLHYPTLHTTVSSINFPPRSKVECSPYQSVTQLLKGIGPSPHPTSLYFLFQHSALGQLSTTGWQMQFVQTSIKLISHTFSCCK